MLCRSFQTFDVNQQSSGPSVYDPTAQYAGGMYAPPTDNNYYGDGGEATEFDTEPPLLEGIFKCFFSSSIIIYSCVLFRAWHKSQSYIPKGIVN